MMNTISKLSFKVLLTGSRYFGNFNDDSDFDFFCGELTDSQKDELLSLNFINENIPREKLFGGVIEVFAHIEEDIHILIVEDVSKRDKLQKIILNYFPTGYSQKNINAKGIWEMANTILSLKTLELNNDKEELKYLKEDLRNMRENREFPTDDSCDYDEENDIEGFEEKMLEYEIYGVDY